MMSLNKNSSTVLLKAAAFLLRPAISVPPAATTSLGAIRCEGKTYQLEEREDSEICTTEVHLNPDRSVLVGDTDGPYFEASAGEWNVAPGTNDFTMRIQKRFRTGQSSTDMGEFAFDVYRVYRGDMALVGDSVAITGVMTDDHDSLHRRCTACRLQRCGRRHQRPLCSHRMRLAAARVTGTRHHDTL